MKGNQQWVPLCRCPKGHIKTIKISKTIKLKAGIKPVSTQVSNGEVHSGTLEKVQQDNICTFVFNCFGMKYTTESDAEQN